MTPPRLLLDLFCGAGGAAMGIRAETTMPGLDMDGRWDG